MKVMYMFFFLYIICCLKTFSKGVWFSIFETAAVMKGEMMFVVCRARQAQNLNTTVMSVHNSEYGNTVVCMYHQRGSECEATKLNRKDGYRCECRVQTDKASSDYKDYTVSKYHTTENDTGVWFCGSDQLDVWSEPKAAVILNNPGLSVYSWTAVIDEPFTFLCSVIRHAYRSKVTFIRDAEVVCECTPTSCVVARSFQSRYTCERNETKPIKVGRRQHFLSSYLLTIPKFSTVDSAAWMCSTSYSNSRVIHPQYAPVVSVYHDYNTEHKTLTVTCLATGKPENFTFSPFTHAVGQHVIRRVQGELVTHNKYKLIIKNPDYQDDGIYVCEVSNGILGINSKQTGETFIKLTEKPVLVGDAQDNETISVVRGENISLEKIIFSYDSITSYTWTNGDNKTGSCTQWNVDIHNVAVENAAYKMSLVIVNAQDRDSGLYILHVCNENGCSKFYTHLHILHITTNRQTTLSLTSSVMSLVDTAVGVMVIIIVIFIVCFVSTWKIHRKNKAMEESQLYTDSLQGEDMSVTYEQESVFYYNPGILEICNPVSHSSVDFEATKRGDNTSNRMIEENETGDNCVVTEIKSMSDDDFNCFTDFKFIED